jgi:hypothetical protein
LMSSMVKRGRWFVNPPRAYPIYAVLAKPECEGSHSLN